MCLWCTRVQWVRLWALGKPGAVWGCTGGEMEPLSFGPKAWSLTLHSGHCSWLGLLRLLLALPWTGFPMEKQQPTEAEGRCPIPRVMLQSGIAVKCSHSCHEANCPKALPHLWRFLSPVTSSSFCTSLWVTVKQQNQILPNWHPNTKKPQTKPKNQTALV